MTSRDDNAKLVDLLYDDELDEEAEAELRAEIEESPEAREVLERNEAFLDRVRETHESAEVPSDVHDAIVREARDAVEGESSSAAGAADDSGGEAGGDEIGGSADEAAPEELAPRTAPDERTPRTEPGSDERSFWADPDNRSTFRKYANAAILLVLAGGFGILLLQIFGERVEQDFQKAKSGVGEEVAFGEEAGSPAPESRTASDEEPTGVAEAPTAPETDRDDPDQTEQKLAQKAEGAPEPSRGDEEASLGSASSPDQQRESEQPERLARRSDSARTDEAPSGAAPEGAAEEAPSTGDSTKSKDDGSAIAAFSDESSTESATGDGASDEEPSAESGKKSADFGGSGGSLAETGSDDGEGDKLAKRQGRAESEASEEEQKAKAEQAAKQKSEPLESAAAAEDWDRVESLADTRIDDDSLPDVERARAYELKARALAERDDVEEAIRTLNALTNSYPNYKPDEIESRKESYREMDETPQAAPGPQPDSDRDPAIMLEKD